MHASILFPLKDSVSSPRPVPWPTISSTLRREDHRARGQEFGTPLGSSITMRGQYATQPAASYRQPTRNAKATRTDVRLDHRCVRVVGDI
jgi:hypothetical protein